MSQCSSNVDDNVMPIARLNTMMEVKKLYNPTNVISTVVKKKLGRPKGSKNKLKRGLPGSSKID